MVIETKRLILRPFQLEDAPAYFKITQDDAIRKFVPYASPSTLEEAIQDIRVYYSNGDFVHDFYLIIEVRETHTVVGALIVTQDINGEFSMSLVMGVNHRMKGYMLEALNGFIANMPSGATLSFLVEKQNSASLELMSKLDVIETEYNSKKHRKFIFVTH